MLSVEHNMGTSRRISDAACLLDQCAQPALLHSANDAEAAAVHPGRP